MEPALIPDHVSAGLTELTLYPLTPREGINGLCFRETPS